MASTTVSGSIQSDASYSLPSCWWTLLLHRGGGAAGVDRGDPDAVLLLLGAQRVGERAQAELRGGVRRPLRVRDQAGAGVDEDERAASGADGGQADPGEHGGRDQVDGQLRLPGLGGQLGDRAEVDDAGGVHHRVERVRQLVGHRLDRGRVGQVGDQHGGVGQVGAQVVGAFGRAGQQDQRVAALEQPLGEDRAHARAGTGEQVGAHQRVNTTLPNTSPSAITAKPSRAWSIGSSGR